MSRKAIIILFIIGACLYVPGIALVIWGEIALFQANLASFPVNGTTPVNPLPPASFSAFIAPLIIGGVLAGIGGIFLLIARIGALIETGKAQDWVWFILMLVFGEIVVLIYLLAGPKPRPVLPQPHPYAYTYPPQAWQGYPQQSPGIMPPVEQGRQGYSQMEQDRYSPRRPQE